MFESATPLRMFLYRGLWGFRCEGKSLFVGRMVDNSRQGGAKHLYRLCLNHGTPA